MANKHTSEPIALPERLNNSRKTCGFIAKNDQPTNAFSEYVNEVIASNPEVSAQMAEIEQRFEEMRAKYLTERCFDKYLNTFESHQRLQPFIDINPLLSDQEYWMNLRDVWIGAEATLPDKQIWLRLLQCRRPERHHLMTESERIKLASLPDVIKIWRGCGERSAKRGLSWTLDRDLAIYFANYACGFRRQMLLGQRDTTPLLVEATCEKRDVLAYYMEREESEIVISSRKVNVARVRDVVR